MNPASWLQTKQTPWISLERGLSKRLNRPVVVQRLQPFQIAAHLQSGRIQFGWMPAREYLELAGEEELGTVILLSEAEVSDRQGLIVTAANSGVQTMEDLKQRRFAFGPKDDVILHRAALETLAEAGISEQDLGRELLPVPGALQHRVSSFEVAKEIVYGLDADALRTAGGVIELADYNTYPDTGGHLLPMATVSKDQLRILARTKSVRVMPIVDGPVVASAEADPELVSTVRAFLLEAGEKNRDVLRDLGVQPFCEPSTQPREDLKELAARDVRPVKPADIPE
jgi:ABC-type phosphate/phosphonate transport system substrate-binding protein